MANKLSPMMEQYKSMKKQYSDAILMFRLGDFYEMFFEDAITASGVLDLTLTGRDCGLEKRAEMCGVPYHAVDNYIKRLIDGGYKVAICEQLNTPEEAKGKMVDRDVVRVITPGTVIDDTLLDEKRANYIAAVFVEKNNAGIAFADIASGEFNCREIDNIYRLEDILLNLEPSEIIADEAAFDFISDMKSLAAGRLARPQKYLAFAFKYQNAEKKLKNQLKVFSLEAFGLPDKKYAVSAAGALMEYLNETQKRQLIHFNKINYVSENSGMILDNNTRRNLELTETIRDKRKKGTLLWLLDRTVTNMGARKMRQIIENPLCDSDKINQRLEAVGELTKNARLRNGLTEKLKGIRDLERLAGKISYGNLTPRDCAAIAETLDALPSIKTTLEDCESRLLKNIGRHIKLIPETRTLLKSAIAENPPQLKDGYFIRTGFNAELDEYRGAGRNGKNMIADLETAERAATGIKNLKIGFNKVFGYYIEVSSSNKELVPYRYMRKQTIVNGERYITEELKNIEDRILGSEEKSLKLEARLFAEIKERLNLVIGDMQDSAQSITMCDVILSFSAVSVIHKLVKPVINEKIKEISIEQGAHPVVKALMNNDFIPNDALLDDDKNRILIITGPNMAGKSTYMRQTAIITLMAHIGCFVPAKSASIALTDRIFTRIGASDDLGLGQSTFMTEMIEMTGILNNMTDKSLLILDEIGRGTSTYDGLSIAWAILEYLSANTKAKTLFSTHYHELAELEGMLSGVKNYKILVKEIDNTIHFLYKIARGGANKSFGIKVASLAGLPKAVVDRAETLMKKLEESDINRDANALMMQASNANKNVRQLNFIEERNDESRVKDEIYNVIADTNFDTCTPIQALTILGNLKELIKK
ncbi:MAG: DNA mismatch repair protein MutS [Clostridiales bacterium]|jgi:DNA mismatch repair protein MutS|nr:DNA mismatch repair protein MutS [Clostridiales bacterium]